jgi:hypothetical protein
MSATDDQNIVFLRRLENLDLAAVIFVRNYLQLQFDGDSLDCYPMLNVITSPQLCTSNEQHGWGQPGFRDSLCDQISRVVTSVTCEPGSCVSIEFDSSARLVIPMLVEFTTAAESLILSFGNDSLVM